MFRFGKLACVVSRNVRPAAYYNQPNPLVTKYIYYNQGIRYYGKDNKKDDQCKLVKTDCKKPRERNECKPPEPKECEKRPMPSLQECSKPNLMSECPKPACPHAEPCKKDNKSVILLALLALAATVGALYYFLSSKKDNKVREVVIKKRKKREIVKVPAQSKDIPNEIPYLLIGGGTAAFAAFRAIKSNDPTAKVLVISNEEQLPYMRPPLSKELWFSDDPNSVKTLDFKQWNGSQRSLYYEPTDFYLKTKDLPVSDHGGVAVATGWTITHLDVVNKIAFLEDGCEIKYEKCLIATGSLPKSLDIFEKAEESVLSKVTMYRTIFDFQCLSERLKRATSIAIIGGGFLGSELACAFGRITKQKEDFKVYQIFKEGGHMGKILPEYLSFWTTDKIKKEGVQVLSNSEVIGVSGSDESVTLTLSSGKSITADLVVVAVGATPNTFMAKKSGLEVDHKKGGYLVNTELQARSHLFVAGDAACFYDPALGRRRIEHHDNAVISGRLAGENMTGASKPYIHQSMFWSDLGPDIGYEAIGIVNSKLPTVGVFAKTKTAETDLSSATAIVSEPDMPDECMKFISKEEEERAIKKKADKLAALAQIEEEKKLAEERKKAAAAKPGEDFTKGVIFYLRDDIIVGIVLWNVFNRMSVARQVLKDQCKYEDLNEVAKLFNIHEE